MSDIVLVKKFISSVEYGDSLEVMFDSLRYTLPTGQDMLEDHWELILWSSRPGNAITKSLTFLDYKNEDLKFLVKLCILDKRQRGAISLEAIMSYYYALLSLDYMLADRKVSSMDSDDFSRVEQFWKETRKDGYTTYYRVLQSFANWYSSNFDPSISYVAPDPRRASYGREGTDEGRKAKKISDEVVASIFSLAGEEDLALKDKFHLNAFVLEVVLQGRINELATLPVDCLNKDMCALRVFSEKSGLLDFRIFPRVLLPVVERSLTFLKSTTEEGREIVKRLRQDKSLDWSRIVKEPSALRYHVKKAVSQWVIENNLLDPSSVWCQSQKKFIDPKYFLICNRYSKVRAAEQCGLSYKSFLELHDKQVALTQGKVLLINQSERFFCDPFNLSHCRKVRINPKALSLKALERKLEYSLYGYKEVVREILDEGLRAQLLGQKIPLPKFDSYFENEFSKIILPVVAIDGVTILEPEHALFIVPRSLLSTEVTRLNDYSLITHGMFREWLNTSMTGEFSLFSIRGIIDPKTGLTPNFKWHDVRHWMQTIYLKGGLTDIQASMLAGRRLARHAAVYDQILAKDRSIGLAQMREDIREGKVFGVVPDTFKKIRLSSESAAEEYLSASTQTVSWMPHGSCSLNVVLTPCQNHLSCFVDGKTGKCCSKLVIHIEDRQAEQQLEKIAENAKFMISHIKNLGGEHSPQFGHFEKILFNVNDVQQAVYANKFGGLDEN
ncbi:hypothetical protein [Pseudomonas poae]|nr:hypothetical protein [Pseudomonas poae]